MSELYAWVKAQEDRFSETPSSLAEEVLPRLRSLPDDISEPLYSAVAWLLADEPYFSKLEPPDFSRMSMNEFVECRNTLFAKQYFFTNQSDLVARFKEGLGRIVRGLCDELPKTEAPSPFTIPLVYALPNVRELVAGLYSFFAEDEYLERGLFKVTSRQFYLNLCAVSAKEPGDPSGKGWKQPADSELPPLDFVKAYLRDTPFLDFFLASVPLKLTHKERFSHMHVVAGSGQGKTVLIEKMMRHDLRDESQPSIILIDPHSDLTRKLVASELIPDDRLILLDPRDTKFPIALNPFALNRERFATYDERTREQVTAGVIQTLSYLWNGLTNLTLTGKQDVFAKYVIRLLLTLPEAGVIENGEIVYRNATILDMLKLMSDPTPYGHAIGQLPDIQRDFFKTDFASKTFEGTKEQVRYRIQAIIESPTMARLFTSPETKVDFFTEMNRGAIILVDTAKDFLKDGSPIFGKLMVSLIFQAVLERAAIDEHDRKPTFLIIDEASSVFSSNIDDLLSESRKYKCGLLLAHQYLDQATSTLRASLAANTAIKFAGGISAGDAGTMARDLRCTPDFILNQPTLQFAAHIRGVTPSAVSIPIEIPDPLRSLSGASLEERLTTNRERVSLPPPKPDAESEERKFRAAFTSIPMPPHLAGPAHPSPQAKNEDFSFE